MSNSNRNRNVETGVASVHTPGPWVIGKSFTPGEIAIREGSDPTNDEPQCLAVVLEPPGWNQDEQRANAALIAAAPALLEALEELAVYASAADRTQHAGVPVPADAWAAIYDATNKARAAIAAARGGVAK